MILTAITDKPGKVTLTTTCPECKSKNEIEAVEDDVKAWLAGMKLQYAMPYLSPDQREMLISGICPTCWNALFPPKR